MLKYGLHEDYNIDGSMDNCGGCIIMVEGMNIRDRIFYLRLFNKKHVKSHESIMYATDFDDAEKLYQTVKTTLPRHVYHEISDYAIDNSRINADNDTVS